jgi:hypothetical protein
VPPIATWIGPSDPGFVAFGALVGGLYGHIIARSRRYNADKTIRATAGGGELGVAISLTAYVVANLVETIFG